MNRQYKAGQFLRTKAGNSNDGQAMKTTGRIPTGAFRAFVGMCGYGRAAMI
jgi:hypothetical protein